MRLRWTLLLLLACVSEKGNDDSDAPGDDDDDVVAGDCGDDDDCDAGFICDEGDQVCVPGDRDTFDDPLDLPFSEDAANPDTVAETISPPGDIDHFGYDSPGDEWVSIRTIVDDDEALDTVVTLYDPSGGEWAVMDDYPVWPFRVSGFDTVLYAWLPDAGLWTITVQDQTTYYTDDFDEEDWRGDESMTYEVLVRAAGGTGEPDSSSSPSVGIDLPDGDTIFTVGVVIDDPGDLDHIELEMPYTDEYLEVWASSGNGSTAQPRVRLFDDTETVVADKTAVGTDGYLSLFRGQAGTYRIEASSDGGSGDDAWFAVYARTYEPGDSHPFFSDNDYDDEVEPNNAPPQASALTVSDLPDYDAFRLEGGFDVAADEDWYRFDVDTDHYVGVRCWTDRFGSLAELEVELYDAAQVLLDSGSDADGGDYYVFNSQVAAGGSHLVRITSDVPTAAGAGQYYRCAVFTTPGPIE